MSSTTLGQAQLPAPEKLGAGGSMVLRDTRPQALKVVQPFLVGGLSGCFATCCIQPIDMVKVRIQLVGDTGAAAAAGSKSPFVVARNVVKNEGLRALYKGLDAGLTRQALYTTARMGLFRVGSDYLKKPNEQTLPLHKKALVGLGAGGLASIVGNPADLSLIRMQADATLPLSQRRNYTGICNALSRTVKDEGWMALWRGATPTVARAMALNMGMLASFDQAKEMLEARVGPGWGATLSASAVAGVFSVIFSLPFDFMKTRIQKMKPDPVTKELPYKGLLDCAFKTYKAGGLTAFYAGLPTYYFRIAPHAMITLILMDKGNSFLKNAFSVPVPATH